jgi:hypothetical protein
MREISKIKSKKLWKIIIANEDYLVVPMHSATTT